MTFLEKTYILSAYLYRSIFNLGVDDPKAWDSGLWDIGTAGGVKASSGEVVNERTALTYSAVYNAISLIAGTVGSLPLHLMQKYGSDKNIFDKNPLYRVMHDQWNPWMTAMSGREALTSHILAWGNGYAEIVRNTVGDIVELWPITPDRVRKIEMREGELIYDIAVGGETVPLPRRQVLHIPGLGFNGLMGYSVIAMAQKSIGLGMALESFGSLYFGQGTHPGVVVKHPEQLDSVGHANLKKSLTEVYSGLGNSHRLMLLEDGMTLEKIGIPPNDTQFLESRQFQIPEIARWFNLPPHKLKDLTRSSFNNIEAEQTSFVTDSMLPWLVRIEQNYNMQLLTPRQVKELLYFHHVVEGLLRGDSKSRGLFYEKMIKNSIYTPNEVRALENKNPHPDPMANELFVPTGMIPMSKFDEYLKKNAPEAPAADASGDEIESTEEGTENAVSE